MKSLFTVVVFSFFGLLSLSFIAKEKLPSDWYFVSDKHYETYLDSTVVYEGRYAACLKSKKKKAPDFATLRQGIDCDLYVGKKVKMSGYLKTEDVRNWASLWLRVDDVNRRVMSFDNMSRRALSGTKDWTYCEIILPVPEGSTTFHYGAMLVGGGKIWVDNINFEIVDDSTPVTGEIRMLQTPQNLDFED